MTVTFDHPSARALARYIAQHLSATENGSTHDAIFAAPAGPELLPSVKSIDVCMPNLLAEMGTIVATVLGGEVGSDEPLMAAGLDSLGEIVVIC